MHIGARTARARDTASRRITVTVSKFDDYKIADAARDFVAIGELTMLSAAPKAAPEWS